MPVLFVLIFIAAEAVCEAVGFSIAETYQVVWAGVMGVFLACALWVDRPE
jgi:hypothetical protein